MGVKAQSLPHGVRRNDNPDCNGATNERIPQDYGSRASQEWGGTPPSGGACQGESTPAPTARKRTASEACTQVFVG